MTTLVMVTYYSRTSKLDFSSCYMKLSTKTVTSRALHALGFVAGSTKQFMRLCKYDLLDLSFVV